VNYTDEPETLTKALLAIKEVKEVKTEFDYWVITLSNNLVIYLGADYATGGTDWNNRGYTLEGFSDNQKIAEVVKQFSSWAKQTIKGDN
jgi:hypothetical protein